MFNNKNISTTSKLLILVLVPWTILAIIFGFTDLEISKAVVGTNPIWAEEGTYYAHVPANMMIIIAVAILIGSFFEGIKIQKLYGAMVGFFLNEFLTDFELIIFRDTHAILADLYTIMGVIVFTTITLNKDWRNYIRFSIFIIIFATLLYSTVDIIKFLCGRVRFRDLSPDYSNYTPWFLPPGPSETNLSFPSTHTAQGWMVLPLIILVVNRKGKDFLKILTFCFVIGWGTFVGISRVLIGAHYASDVLFSTGIAAVFTIILYKWFFLNIKRDRLCYFFEKKEQ